MKIYWYGDWHHTGYGRASRQFVRHLAVDKGHKVDMFAVNWYGHPYDRLRYPVEAWPVANPYADADWLGRAHMAKVVRADKPDVLIVLNDAFHFMGDEGVALHEACLAANTRLILSFPVDCYRIPPSWLQFPKLVDEAVVWNETARETIARTDPELAKRLRVVPLGLEPEWFQHTSTGITENIRSQLLRGGKSRLVVCVNRNCARKDWARTLCVAAEVIRQRPEVAFYFHTQTQGVAYGQVMEPIHEMAEVLGLTPGLDYDTIEGAPHNWTEIAIRSLYAAGDVYLTCTAGEGWGLTAFEAAAAGTPVVLPRTTAYSAWPKGGCYEIAAGRNLDYLVPLLGAGAALYPVISVESAVAKVLEALRDVKSGEKPKRAEAMAWAASWTWERAFLALDEVLEAPCDV